MAEVSGMIITLSPFQFANLLYILLSAAVPWQILLDGYPFTKSDTFIISRHSNRIITLVEERLWVQYLKLCDSDFRFPELKNDDLEAALCGWSDFPDSHP